MIARIDFPVNAIDFASVIISKCTDNEDCYFDKELAKKFNVDLVVGTALELESVRSKYQMASFVNEEHSLQLSAQSYGERDPQARNSISQLQIPTNVSPRILAAILNGYSCAILNGSITVIIELVEESFLITKEMVSTIYPQPEQTVRSNPILVKKSKIGRVFSVVRSLFKPTNVIGNHVFSFFCLAAIIWLVCNLEKPNSDTPLIGQDKSVVTPQVQQSKARLDLVSK